MSWAEPTCGVLGPDDGGFAVGTYRHDADGGAGGLLDVGDVVGKGTGELGFGAHLGEGRVPAGHFFVNGFPACRVVGHIGDGYAVFRVGGAYLDGLETVEHVALHHHEVRHAVDHDGVFEGYEVEPAAAAVAPRDGTVFIADVADGVAGLVEQLHGEGAASDTCAVCLEDAEDVADGVGSDTQTGAYAAAGGGGR